MANFVYIAASLDGFIADPEGGIEWLTDLPNLEGSDYGWGEFIGKIDAIVMGRVTFEKVHSFGTWPYEVPVFVLSSTLESLPAGLGGTVELLRGGPREITGELRERGYQDLYIDGGRTVQGFLAADLIDELILTRVPILLGSGIPLFGELEEQLEFEHQGTVVFPNGLVKSHYVRKEPKSI